MNAVRSEGFPITCYLPMVKISNGRAPTSAPRREVRQVRLVFLLLELPFGLMPRLVLTAFRLARPPKAGGPALGFVHRSDMPCRASLAVPSLESES